MRSETLFQIKTVYRQPLDIICQRFGEGEKALAIVGQMRGNEVQQLYICSQLIRELALCEREGMLAKGQQIAVIPSVNPFSMNLNKRFWAVDNTDINRMYPGYDRGETTQRIAASLFEHVKGYRFGVQYVSFYMPGNFVPHVRILDTGYQDASLADEFELPYVMLSAPHPIDTGTLNYNWQIFGTSAFSIYSRETKNVHEASARQAVEATMRFMESQGLLKRPEPRGRDPVQPPAEPLHFREEDLVNVLSEKGGINLHRCSAGDAITTGDPVSDTIDPYTGLICEQITAPCSGRIFFSHNANLIGGHEVACRIIPSGEETYGE